jgi:hypothetical protein
MRWRTATTVGWLFLSAATGGCYHQYLRVTRSDQLPEKEQKTVYSYAWGLVHSRDSVTVCGETRALDQVEVKSNFGMTLLGILTLGIVVPRRMIWYCSTPRECPDDIGLSTSTPVGPQACRTEERTHVTDQRPRTTDQRPRATDQRPRATDQRPRVIPSAARDRLASTSE